MSSVSIEHRLAITDGVHAFYAWVDGGHASRTTALFTRNARLTFGLGSPQPGTIEGDAIATAMVAREAQTSAFTRHAVSNLVFSAGEDGIEVGYLLTLYRSDDDSRDTKPAFVADVEERWQHEEAAWLIAERTILPAFKRS